VLGEQASKKMTGMEWGTDHVGPAFYDNIFPQVKLPNGERSIIDVEGKLLGYCLNLDHRLGQHKARVFASTIGITAQNPVPLVLALRDASANGEARFRKTNDFGAEYEVEFIMQGPKGNFVVVSGWFIDAGAEVPRLTNCYVSLKRTKELGL
jgi:hypothetical protein